MESTPKTMEISEKEIGIDFFKHGQYKLALEAFNKARVIDESDKDLVAWIRKTNAELELVTTSSESTNPLCEPVSEIQQKPITMDFYQTPTHVTISIFVKNQSRKNITVEFEKKSLDVNIKIDTNRYYNLYLDLFGEIMPSESKIEILTTKVDIKMKKLLSGMWNSLEAPPEGLEKEPVKRPKYPSSSKNPVNPDEINVEDDKKTGDAALMDFFQKIFANSNEEQQRAMNKSFWESGGTSLNTNWKDVANKTIEPSAPDGMELKHWKDFDH